MFWNRKPTQNKPVWRDTSGKINCPGDNCSQECDDRCPIWLNTRALEKLMCSQPETAISYLKQAIEIAPDFADSKEKLAQRFDLLTCFSVFREHDLS